jgi:hypothetical protein
MFAFQIVFKYTYLLLVSCYPFWSCYVAGDDIENTLREDLQQNYAPLESYTLTLGFNYWSTGLFFLLSLFFKVHCYI